jgi:hypothetical protein
MTAQDRQSVVNIFTTKEEARNAISELLSRGFTAQQIGFAYGAGEHDGLRPGETYGSEGAVAGLATGAGVGALWGLGIAAGVLPVIGPAIAGGTLAAILGSAAAGAAAVGYVGTMIGMGIPKEDAEFYETELQSNRVVVIVTAPGREVEVADVLARHGGFARGSSVFADIVD